MVRWSRKVRFIYPEALFQPHNIKKEFPCLSELIYHSIMKCDVLLDKQIVALAPPPWKTRASRSERKYSAWIGSS